MKKLIVSGCSWGDKIFFSPFHPDMDTDWPKWPEILAEKLGMECVNLCRCGAGQEYIYSSLCDYIQKTPKEEIGQVIAAWSTAPRRDYSTKDRWTNDRQDIRGDLKYWVERSIRYQYAFQTLMEYEKLPYLQFQMISLYRGHLWELKKDKFKLSGSRFTRPWELEKAKKDREEYFSGYGVDLKKMTAKTFGEYTVDENGEELNNEKNNTIKKHKYLKIKESAETFGEYQVDENGEKLKEIVLNTIKNSPYYKKFNDRFFNWPGDDELGGFSLEFGVLKEEHKISELDRHPNAKGQERIAEYLYDRLG